MPFLSKLMPWIVTGFLVGAGSWILAWSWDQVSIHRALEHGAASIEGRVIDRSSRELQKGGQSWTLLVEYAPPGGRSLTKEFDVDGATYREATADGTVQVTYLPTDPEVARVTRFAILPFQALIGLGALMLAAGLFCFAHTLRAGGVFAPVGRSR